MLLTASDLPTARLFAEGARLSLSHASIRDVPDGLRATASFGVAARSGADNLSELLHRADSALYNAKKAGRDCVRLSYQRVAETMAPVATTGIGGDSGFGASPRMTKQTRRRARRGTVKIRFKLYW